MTDLKVSIETSTTEYKESQSGQHAVDFRLTTETKANLIMTLENFSRDTLAMALRGGYTTIAAGEATAAPIKVYLGKVVSLPHVKVSDVVVKKAAATLVAYTDDTTPYDYQLNADARRHQVCGHADGLRAGGWRRA